MTISAAKILNAQGKGLDVVETASDIRISLTYKF